MTLKNARKLKQGDRIYNIETGEASMVSWTMQTKGSMLFIECIDPLGKFSVWTYKQIERE
jgi:hypothetical protein